MTIGDLTDQRDARGKSTLLNGPASAATAFRATSRGLISSSSDPTEQRNPRVVAGRRQKLEFVLQVADRRSQWVCPLALVWSTEPLSTNRGGA